MGLRNAPPTPWSVRKPLLVVAHGLHSRCGREQRYYFIRLSLHVYIPLVPRIDTTNKQTKQPRATYLAGLLPTQYTDGRGRVTPTGGLRWVLDNILPHVLACPSLSSDERGEQGWVRMTGRTYYMFSCEPATLFSYWRAHCLALVLFLQQASIYDS